MPPKDVKEAKVVMVGDGGVGKSCLTIRHVSGSFVSEYDPTIEDSYRKQVSVDEEEALMDIFDTAGQEEFSAMRNQQYRLGDVFMIVYSVGSRVTFESLDRWISSVARGRDAEEDSVPILLVGNKCDLTGADRQVSKAEGAAYAKSRGLPFFETSAKENINVDEAFNEAIRLSRDFDKQKAAAEAEAKKKKKQKKKVDENAPKNAAERAAASPVHTEPVFAVKAVRDTVWSSSRDGTVREWDAASGDLRGIYTGHEAVIYTFAVVHGQDPLAFPELASGDKVPTPTAPPGAIPWGVNLEHDETEENKDDNEPEAVAESDKGKILANNLVPELKEGEGDALLVSKTAQNPKGDGQPRGVELPLPVIGPRKLTGDAFRVISVSDDGHMNVYAAVGAKGTAEPNKWKQPEVKPLHRVRCQNESDTSQFSASCVSVVDGTAFVGTHAATVSAWAWEDAHLKSVYRGNRSPVLSLVATKWIVAAGCADGRIRLWSVQRPDAVAALLLTHDAGVMRMLSLPAKDSQPMIATGDARGFVCTWNLATGARSSLSVSCRDSINSMATDTSGSVVVGSRDRTARLITSNGGKKEETVYACLIGSVRAVAASASTKQVFLSGKDGTVRAYDRDTAEPQWSWDGHEGFVNCLAMSPDEKTVYSGGRDGTVRAWDSKSGSLRNMYASSWERLDALYRPRLVAAAAVIGLFVEFFQLSSFAFTVPDGGFAWNPSHWALDFLPAWQLEIDFSALFEGDRLLFASVLISMLLYILFFTQAYRLKPLTKADNGSNGLRGGWLWTIAKLVIEVGSGVAFIPAMRKVFEAAACEGVDLGPCYTGEHLAWTVILVAVGMVYLVIAFRLVGVSGDLARVSVYDRMSWRGDSPDLRRLHGMSRQSARFARAALATKLGMIAVTVGAVVIGNLGTAAALVVASLGISGATLYWPPYHETEVSALRFATLAGVVWTNIMGVYVVVLDDEADSSTTDLHVTVLPVFALIGAFIMYLRTVAESKAFAETRRSILKDVASGAKDPTKLTEGSEVGTRGEAALRFISKGVIAVEEDDEVVVSLPTAPAAPAASPAPAEYGVVPAPANSRGPRRRSGSRSRGKRTSGEKTSA